MTDLLSLPAGTVLVDDYRIERVLGAGGFGITYLARETDVDRLVTIKEYFPTDFASRGNDLAAVPRSRGTGEDYQWGLDRFIEEARTLGKFDHLNIVRLYRYFRANNTAYMVLHFEEGQSLKSWLNALGRAPRQKELDPLVAPLLDALSVIHAADFLHRDIAPDNIIVRKDGSPVLIDFGSARGEIAQHTRTISALVKPGYSPYEQYAETGRTQGPWTDIYAFAGTLYHTVTGKRPPDSPSRVIKDELKPAAEAAIGAYRSGFLKAIDRGLALDIEQRPQSVAAWRGDLLAPAEPPPRWFARGDTDGRDDLGAPPAGEAPTRPPTEPLTVAPPPDAPGRGGQFVDFVERLKKRNQQRDAEPEHDDVAPPEAPPEPEPALTAPEPTPTASAPARRSAASRFRIGWGARRQPAQPAPAPASAAEAVVAEVIEPQPAAAQQLPVPVAPRKPPRVFRRSRPRPVRGLSGSRWRPLLFKLLIGLGLASGAVALQDRLPKFELHGTGTVSSGTEPQARAATSPPGRRKQTPPPPVLLHKFRAHDSAITKAAFAMAGQLTVTTGADGTMRIWDTDSRALIRTIELDDGPATALATRGPLALTGHSEGVVVLWNLETGHKRKSFNRNAAGIHAVAFAGSDGRFWAAAHDWTIALWETSTPSAPLHVFQDHDSAVQAVAYAPSRSLLVSGSADKTVKVWSGTNLSLLRTYSKTRDFVMAVAVSEDGNTIAAGTLDGRIRTMSAKSRRYRETRAHDGAVVDLAFSPDGGRLISAGRDGTLKTWNVRRRRLLRTYGSGGTALAAFDITPDGKRLISADIDGYVRLWNAASPPTKTSRR